MAARSVTSSDKGCRKAYSRPVFMNGTDGVDLQRKIAGHLQTVGYTAQVHGIRRWHRPLWVVPQGYHWFGYPRLWVPRTSGEPEADPPCPWAKIRRDVYFIQLMLMSFEWSAYYEHS